MACFTFIVILSLLCLLPGWEYHPDQWTSSSTINELLSSEAEGERSPNID